MEVSRGSGVRNSQNLFFILKKIFFSDYSVLTLSGEFHIFHVTGSNESQVSSKKSSS